MDRALERSKPLYLQVSDRMEARILSGELTAGDRLPTTRELASQLGVTLQTAQQGAALLQRRGMIERIPGRGSFVSRRIHSQTIGVVCGRNVFGNLDLLFYQRIYGVLCTELRQRGWDVNLYFPTVDAAPEQCLSELAHDVGRDRLRGLIILYGRPWLTDWLRDHPGIPCRPSSACPPPAPSRRGEVYRGIDYLLGRGYRHLAVVAHTLTSGAVLLDNQRREIAMAYADRDLPLTATVYTGDAASHAAGVAQARRALEDAAPDAFFVLNDMGCMGVIFELLCQGRHIPADVGILAVANGGIDIPCPVPLTRFEVDPVAFARAEIEAVLAAIEGREPPPVSRDLPLAIGKSCGE